MLIETPGGFDYTGADCAGWMKEAGFSRPVSNRWWPRLDGGRNEVDANRSAARSHEGNDPAPPPGCDRRSSAQRGDACRRRGVDWIDGRPDRRGRPDRPCVRRDRRCQRSSACFRGIRRRMAVPNAAPKRDRQPIAADPASAGGRSNAGAVQSRGELDDRGG